ncbi:glycosyltransferase family 4 protein [Croceibacterium selenioxidans]
MVKRGWRVTVLAFDEPASRSYYDYDPAVEIVSLGYAPARRPAIERTLRTVTRIHVLRRALDRLRPDVVLSFLTRTNVVALLATIGMDIPVVVSERNNPEVQNFGRIWSVLRAKLYPSAFGLVTMTPHAMDFFPEKMRRRGWVIPNPVMPPVVQARAEPSDTRTVVAVGRLVRQKGFDLLLRAFARIAASHPDWNLVIWGEGEERPALEQEIARLGLEGRASLPGITAQPGGWASGADLFVMSSRYEGWGNVLLEALAAGIPSISFDCPWGPREMVKDGVNGLLVRAEEVPALAAALSKMMDDPALRERLAAEARRSAERFTPGPIVTAWEQTAEAAIARKRLRQDESQDRSLVGAAGIEPATPPV